MNSTVYLLQNSVTYAEIWLMYFIMFVKDLEQEYDMLNKLRNTDQT